MIAYELVLGECCSDGEDAFLIDERCSGCRVVELIMTPALFCGVIVDWSKVVVDYEFWSSFLALLAIVYLC